MSDEAAAQPQPGEVRRPRWWRRALRAIWVVLRSIVLIGLAGWATLAVSYADLSGRSPRTILAGAVAVLLIGSMFLRKPPHLGIISFFVLFAIVLGWYFSIRPSNERNWLPDVAVLPYAEIDGDRVTIHNIRNFDYTTEEQYTPAYYTREFNLSKLKSVDYILSYWGPRAIAHSMASFQFEDGQCIAISIETRKEKGEQYSAVQGFFRQYELTYVIADERDVLRLRTNYRNEDVYLYHTRVSATHGRMMLLDYLKSANALRTQPEFYNALTTNCATSILPHIQTYNPAARLSVSLLLNGHSAEAAHARGGLDQSMPFEQLQQRSRINEAARQADKDPNFSAVIRAALPPIPQQDR